MSIGRQDYDERREARADRMEERASAAQAASDAAYKASHDILHMIPMGQPILVGHHSEARHRRDLDRADRNMRKSCEASEKADYYAARAETARKSTAISGDDPDAVEKLQTKLAQLQADQERDKALNAHYRKHKTLRGFEDISDEEAAKLDAELSAMREAIRRPVPEYQLSNRNSEIRRLKDRIAQLQQVDEMEHVEIPFDGGTLLTNEDVNRVQILFDEKPDEETRDKLKSRGFRWSPMEKAWQTLRTPRNLRAAKYLLGITDTPTQDETSQGEAAAPDQDETPQADPPSDPITLTESPDTETTDYPQLSLPLAE